DERAFDSFGRVPWRCRCFKNLGCALMLSLTGTAKSLRGFEGSSFPQLLRTCSPSKPPEERGDSALVECAADVSTAIDNGFATIGTIDKNADCTQNTHSARTTTLLISFAYLARGDILSVRSVSGKVRFLFRRSSRHNAFLVTDRCNHYCLMCSQ